VSTNDGILTSAPPRAASGSDPVVWAGGSSPCDIQSDQWGAGAVSLGLNSLGLNNPCDHDDLTLGAGPGALTYTTAPFPSARVVGGPIDATLYATATTTDTELAATIEEVSPTGQSVPLTSGALLGSLRQESAATWMGSNHQPILPGHPYTQASARPVVPGAVTRYDISVFPTFALIPTGWRLRVTITTGDTPHLGVTPAQMPHLLGGVYQVQRHAGAASFINVPLAAPTAFRVSCGKLCGATGP
jgi:predicted acyl esterase